MYATYSNKLSRDGAGHIAKLLTTNRHLKTVDLSCNHIESEGLVAISEALKEANTNLER